MTEYSVFVEKLFLQACLTLLTPFYHIHQLYATKTVNFCKIFNVFFFNYLFLVGVVLVWLLKWEMPKFENHQAAIQLQLSEICKLRITT